MSDLTIHRLKNAHPIGLPHWAELVETIGVACYDAPERVLPRLSYLFDKGMLLCTHSVGCNCGCNCGWDANHLSKGFERIPFKTGTNPKFERLANRLVEGAVKVTLTIN